MLYNSLWKHFANCVEYCQFVPWGFDRTVAIVRAMTGWNVSLFELMNVARRAVTLSRMFNIVQGFTSGDDRLPPRMWEAFKEGAMKGRQLTPEMYEEAKVLYYGMLGWDDDGVPRRATLYELGIGWAEEFLPTKSKVAN